VEELKKGRREEPKGFLWKDIKRGGHTPPFQDEHMSKRFSEGSRKRREEYVRIFGGGG